MKRSIHHPTWKEISQATLWIVFAFTLIFLCAAFQECRAQNVTLKGNTFVQQPSEKKLKKDSVTLTPYFYETSDGTKYPIYRSYSGKYFIWRISSKTGKKYRMYLPEVTKKLSKK